MWNNNPSSIRLKRRYLSWSCVDVSAMVCTSRPDVCPKFRAAVVCCGCCEAQGTVGRLNAREKVAMRCLSERKVKDPLLLQCMGAIAFSCVFVCVCLRSGKCVEVNMRVVNSSN